MVVGQGHDPAGPSRVFALQQNSPAEEHPITQRDVDGSTNKAADTLFSMSVHFLAVGRGGKCDVFFK